MLSHRQLGLPSASTAPAHSLSAAQVAQNTEIKKVQHEPNPGIGHSKQPPARPQNPPRFVIRRANGASSPSLSAGQASKKPENRKVHIQRRLSP